MPTYTATMSMLFNPNQPGFQDLRNLYAETTQSVVFWVGAGLSVPAGLPTWKSLREALERSGLQKAASLEEPERTQQQRAVENIKGIKSYWRAFEALKKQLGKTTYRSCIRSQLSAGQHALVPEIYGKLWEMRVGGILSLNLDRFASRAHASVRPAEKLHEFVGLKAGEYLHLLKSFQPFVVNLHGVTEEAGSWVFQEGELKFLLQSSYTSFIDAVFASRAVVFLGMSADDEAAGGLLKSLTLSGADAGSHFWVTSRRDAATDRWAEESGIQVIRYKADADHTGLRSFIDELLRYRPIENDAVPIAGKQGQADVLPSAIELAGKTPEQIRLALNAHASKIIATRSDDSRAEYDTFCQNYDRAIWNAWYVSEKPPENVVFGYTLLEQLGEGAFGRVYKARTGDDEIVALKLLRQEVRTSAGMLGSFRRGVRSMQILTEEGVDGMVPYLDAYELPACTVMEYIEGPTLAEAVYSDVLDLQQKLRIAQDLVRIIRAGHLLPARVLHRDIKATNIMLKDFYTKPTDWQLVVLDFDLSWHREALERSVEISAAASLGYLAPEQLQKLHGVSTRNALVDSFGLGMTLYFVFSGEAPRPGDHQLTEWPTRVRDQLIGKINTPWSSLPIRLARLIVWATQTTQSERVDAGQIWSELERLRECAKTGTTVYAELCAEELMARSCGCREYEWNPHQLAVQTTLQSGIKLMCEADEVQRLIKITATWASPGHEDRRRIEKYLQAALENVVAQLKRGGWRIVEASRGAGDFVLSATIQSETLLAQMEDAVKAISGVRQLLRFD